MPLAARQSVVPGGVPVVIARALRRAGALLEVAWGQTAPPPGPPTLTPDERAFTERNPERWQRMSPQEQQRALERYRHWRALSPEDRRAPRRKLQHLPPPPPPPRAPSLGDLHPSD